MIRLDRIEKTYFAIVRGVVSGPAVLVDHAIPGEKTTPLALRVHRWAVKA